MLDKSKVGHQFPPFSIELEKGRLSMFANTIGETNPIYNDEQSAIAAGYKSIPALPTFLFSIELDGPELLPVLSLLNMDIARLLHGSQEFEYFEMIFAGDRITVSVSLVDLFDKKDGALEFLVLESSFINESNKLIAKATNTLVYQNN